MLDFIIGIVIGIIIGALIARQIYAQFRQNLLETARRLDITANRIRRHNAAMIGLRDCRGRFWSYLSVN